MWLNVYTKAVMVQDFLEQNVMIVAPYGVKMETVLGHTQKSRSAVLMEQNVRVVEKVQLLT